MDEADIKESEVTWDDVKPGSPAWRKGMAAAKECEVLHHLAWPRDLQDIEYAMGVLRKPETYECCKHAYQLIGDVADRLREARDHPEKRERERWQKMQFCAAMCAGREWDKMFPFLRSLAREFDTMAPAPADENNPYAVAVYSVAQLLDVITSDPGRFTGVQQAITAKFKEVFLGMRRGRIVNGQFVLNPVAQVIPFPSKPFDEPAPAA